MTANASWTRRLAWRLEATAYDVVETILGQLTPAEACRWGARLGSLARRCSPRYRRIVERNLRIAFAGEKSPAELATLATEVWRRAGANLLAAVCTATLDEAGLRRAVEIEGQDILDHAFARGKGLVALLAHMGNWEVMAQVFPQAIPAGRQAADIYRQLSNPWLDARTVALRSRHGLRLFLKSVNPLSLATYLNQGHGLGIMSDQRAGNAGVITPFFGRLTSCTPLPYILARKTGAAVVGVSIQTLAPGRWRFRLHALEGAVTVENCTALLERMLRASPADVFWLQDRWKPNRDNPVLVNGKQPRPDVVAAIPKRRRLLIWIPDDGSLPPSPPPGQPADVQWEYAVASGSPAAQAMNPAAPSASAVLAPPPARVHLRAAGGDRRAWAQALQAADNAETLPLEAVLTLTPDRALRRAARSVGLPVYAWQSLNTATDASDA